MPPELRVPASGLSSPRLSSSCATVLAGTVSPSMTIDGISTAPFGMISTCPFGSVTIRSAPDTLMSSIDAPAGRTTRPLASGRRIAWIASGSADAAAVTCAAAARNWLSATAWFDRSADAPSPPPP